MKIRIKKVLQSLLPVISELRLEKLTKSRADFSRPVQMLLSLKYRELANTQNASLDFEQVGFNVYSSNYEDGILLYIFSLIGMTTKKCVDIGSGVITGSNVANLIINHGFTGLLIDRNPKNIERARKYYAKHPETREFPPRLISATITTENVNKILTENSYLGEMDLLSIDIDGVDYWIWKAIDVIQPRVVIVEYQDNLGPDRAWTVPYKPDFSVHDYPVNKQYYNYCGASLRAFVKLGKQKGYRLVGCNKGGWNAFFVQMGISEKNLPEVTVESCFKYEWNRFSMEQRFPLVKHMDWQEV
jgi:hypothetical protein